MSYELEIEPLRGRVSVLELTTIAEEMFRESRFSPLGFHKRRTEVHAKDVLSNDNFLAFGAFDLGVLCGMCIGVCGAVLPFTDAVIATQHFLFVQPSHRGGLTASRLIHAFINEAKRRGTQDIVFSNGYGGGPEKVGKLFELCGLTHIGGVYSLEV